MDTMNKLSGWLCGIQTLFLLLGIFLTRVSNVKYDWYIKITPDLCYYFLYISQGCLPGYIILIQLVGFLLIDDVYLMSPYMTFVLFVQIIVQANYLVELKEPFLEGLAHDIKERNAEQARRKRKSLVESLMAKHATVEDADEATLAQQRRDTIGARLVEALLGKANGYDKDGEFEKALEQRSLEEETDEERKYIEDILREESIPYKDQIREQEIGEVRLGKGLELREDLYAVAFLHWFKIEHIFGEEPANIQES